MFMRGNQSTVDELCIPSGFQRDISKRRKNGTKRNRTLGGPWISEESSVYVQGYVCTELKLIIKDGYDNQEVINGIVTK